MPQQDWIATAALVRNGRKQTETKLNTIPYIVPCIDAKSIGVHKLLPIITALSTVSDFACIFRKEAVYFDIPPPHKDVLLNSFVVSGFQHCHESFATLCTLWACLDWHRLMTRDQRCMTCVQPGDPAALHQLSCGCITWRTIPRWVPVPADTDIKLPLTQPNGK